VTDRQTDRILIAIDRVCTPCSAVKIMVASSKVNFMYPSVTETNTEHYNVNMYICFDASFVLLFS